jgi:hypothetical protein
MVSDLSHFITFFVQTLTNSIPIIMIDYFGCYHDCDLTALESDPNFMLTASVANNGRCPVYVSLMGFRLEKHRDITGQSNDYWGNTDPNAASTKYIQPWFRMNLGPTGTLGGMASQAQVTTQSTNWYSIAAGPKSTDYTVFDGKFVDGKATEYFRLPIITDTILGCTEMPMTNRTYFSLDVAHLSATATNTIPFTSFPGAFDQVSNAFVYAGCTSSTSANVTVTVRWGELPLMVVKLFFFMFAFHCVLNKIY